jgi:hypothetical protein
MPDSSISILGIGSSHLGAMERGSELIANRTKQAGLPRGPIALAAIQLREERFRPQYHYVDKVPTLNPALGEEIARIIDEKNPRAILSCVGGAVHFEAGWVKYDQAFDTVLPGRTELPLDEAAVFIPYNAVKDTMAHRNAAVFGILDLVKALVPLPIYHFSPPPPVADSRLIDDYVTRWERQIAVAAASTRFKLWSCYVDALRDYCTEAGIIFVPPPEVACDAEGFLKEEFVAADAHHANARYGEAALGQLLSLLNEPASEHGHDTSLQIAS